MLQNPDKDVMECVAEALAQRKDPFDGLGTRALQEQYIHNNFDVVEFKEIHLGTVLVRRKKGANKILTEKAQTFIYIPIIKSLEQLFSNKRIAELIFAKKEFSEGFYYDITDGEWFKEDQYFKDHPDALMVIIFHDELEICNPLGSRASVHKVDMFYYIFANLTPKFRSKHSAVRLIAIANAKHVKSYGIEKILSPVIEDLKRLYEGVKIVVAKKIITVYGKVVAATGDNEGQHQWGGFKEGFGVAFQKCRHCLCEFEQMQRDFSEEQFVLRTKQNCDQQCHEIETAPNRNVRVNLETTYGT